MSYVKKAIIIGGGPAGLAAALRLKTHNGIDTAVYELRREPTTLGGAINIPPNGLRLFDRLGLFDQLATRGSSASQFILHSMQSATLVDIDRASWSRPNLGYGFMRALRSDVVDVLLKATQDQGIPVHFGKQLQHISEDSEGVTVKFSDGTVATADLLLGCDGIHSAVRKLHISPAALPEYSGISNMFAILPTPRLAKGNDAISAAFHGTLTPAGLVAVTPCTATGDHLYWFYSREVALPDSEGDREGWEAFSKNEVEHFKDNVQQVIKDANGSWADQLREIINKTDTIKFYPIYKMPQASIWSTKRCLLIGDSAHAMQPHVGQGTSMALEDVFLLSRLLEHESYSLDQAFEKYEAIRRPRVEAISRESADSGDIRKNTSALMLRMKETLIGVGFWFYNALGLQQWGVGMSQKDFVYDIMEEPI